MKIKYKLLDNSRGVVLSRQPRVLKDALQISFIDAPPSATAIFESDGVCFYRALEDGCCQVPCDKLRGEVKVTVAVLSGSACSEKWKCESLKADKLDGAQTLICPDDTDIPREMTELRLENQRIREELRSTKERLDDMDARFTKMLEGYDLV